MVHECIRRSHVERREDAPLTKTCHMGGVVVFCGRGDGGSPTIRECLFPRSEGVIETLRPLDEAMCEALDSFATGVLGVSGAWIRMSAVLEGVCGSTIISASLVSGPLSSCTENSSSDWDSSTDAKVGKNLINP